MTQWSPSLERQCEDIVAIVPKGRRRLVALAGPPGSGKSTLAAALVSRLTSIGSPARVVPMDGFHLDNSVLEARGLLARKGAPETFDAAGFVRLIHAVAHEEEVVFPVFDRTRDIAIAGADIITAEHETLVIEGNYLLLNQSPWRALAALWDDAALLEVPLDVLRARLIQRWLDHGHTAQQAADRADANDMANARLVLSQSLPVRRITS